MNVLHMLVLLITLFVLFDTIWTCSLKFNWESKIMPLRFWNVLCVTLIES